MKLENNMELLISSMGKLFKVTHICNSAEEANQIMSGNPDISCITEDEQGRVYLADNNPLTGNSQTFANCLDSSH